MPRLAVPLAAAFAAAERNARRWRVDYAVVPASRPGCYGIREVDEWVRRNARCVVGVVGPDGARRRTL